MGYYINPNELMSMFAVPSSVADKHLKLASAEQLKVLLWCIKNSDKGFNVTDTAEYFNFDEDTVKEALDYWIERGVLLSTGEPAAIKKEKTTARAVRAATIKPGRDEVARRGLECNDIAFVLRESEKIFGRGLRDSEASTLVWLYDDLGISASLLLMIVNYAVAEGRPNINFIERTAVEWTNDDITDVEAAEKRLVDMRRRKSAWHLVETVMGIERRSPSAAELEAADKWVNEWGFDREIIRQAYEACVNSTSKVSIPYIKKILAEWHKAGVKTVDDIPSLIPKKEIPKKSNVDDYIDFVNQIIRANEEAE